MPRVQVLTTNFSAGEFSPELEGRADLEKYNSSAPLLRNVVVMKQGGVTIRPPMRFKAVVHSTPGNVRPVPFVFSRTDAYMLEMGFTMRVWRDRELVEASPGVPYTLTTGLLSDQIAEMDYASSGDTMVIVHPDIAPKRLRRFADNQWVFDSVPFAPSPMYEAGERPTTTVTLSLGTVGTGRTATSTSPAFLASDVGRTLTFNTGTAVITAWSSTTVVTVDITQAFSNTVAFTTEWTIGASPQTTCTPSAATPVGGAVNLTLSAAGWRSTDVGSHVDINGGLVRITGFTSTTILAGVIVRELDGTTAAPADAWVLLHPAWNAIDGYPTTVSFYQQRLWFGGTARFPQTVWGSRPGLSFDFTPGSGDDDAVYKTAEADDSSPLQWLVGTKSLIMLGYGAEFEGKGGIEKPATQSNMQINVESEWGTDNVRPQTIGKEILFAERGGTTLRALFPQDVDGYESTDVSVFSQHLLASGLKSISYERKPNNVLWAAMNDGTFAAFSYDRKDQAMTAWCSASTDGLVEWFATVPEGVNDVTYATVVRTIDGVETRNFEIMDWSVGNGKYDSMASQTDSPAKATWDGASHLEGKTIAVVADDVYMGTFTVTGGEFTLPRTALAVSYGIPYTAEILMRSPEVGTGTGTSQGQAQSTNKIWVRMLNSLGLKVNDKVVPFRSLGAGVLDEPVPLFTGLKEVTNYGWGNGESPVRLTQDQGAPWTVLAVVRSVTVNSG
jgi:hypothetical protein